MVYVFHIKICIIKFILQFSIWKWHISWQKLFSQSSWLYFFFYDKILEIRGQKGKQKTLVNHLTPSGRRNIGKQKTLVTNFYLMEKNEIYNKILYTNSSYFWFSFSIINYYIIKISVLCFSNVLENSPGGKKKKTTASPLLPLKHQDDWIDMFPGGLLGAPLVCWPAQILKYLMSLKATN